MKGAIIGLVFLIAIFIGIIYFLFSMPGCRQTLSHYKSNIIGLNRTIAVYDNNGKVIKKWETDTNVEDRGGSFRFLTNDGKTIQISGTVIIEEK